MLVRNKIYLHIFLIHCFLYPTCLLSNDTTKTTDEIKIIFGTFFNKGEVEIKPEDKWWVIDKNENDFILSPIDIKIKTVFDPTKDNFNNPTGQVIEKNNLKAPLLFISGLNNLKKGKLNSYNPANNYPIRLLNDFPKPEIIDLRHEFEFNGNRYSIYVISKTDNSEFPGSKSYKIYLTKNKEQTQLLLHQKRVSDGIVNILWIGDLDRDNKVDILLEPLKVYHTILVRLYLSSFASKSEIVKEVAKFQHFLD